jgi:integrase
MPKQNLLTNLKVSKAACPSDKKYEWHQDGNGLLLRVDRQKNKTWTSRLFNKGKETKRGIGSYPTISLQSAREINLEFKKQWAKGIDPSVEKKKAKHNQINQTGLTFEKAYLQTLKDKIIPNSSDGHIKRWKEAYSKYLKNTLGQLPLVDIDDYMLLTVLEGIYKKAPSSAEKIKSQINVIYTHMKEKRLFKNPNPVNELKGNSLIKPPKAKHYVHLEESVMGDFLLGLIKEPNLVVTTLLYLITVTALRTGSARNARWSWLDTKTNTLTVPGQYMKGRVSFRCPLPKQAMVKLMALKNFTGSKQGYIFEGLEGKPVSDATPRLTLQRITGDKTTVHGFRTLYSRVVSKMGKWREEVIEAQLTHAFAKTEMRQLYLGAEDFLDQRRELVQAYADWCDKQ